MPELLRRHSGTARLAGPLDPFQLESGSALAPFDVAYESYGTLNASGNNAILICHALTGSAHAAGVDGSGRKGWWEGLIGPGKALDTDRYFILCSNILGSCYGSTGPSSIEPATGKRFGSRFPAITVRDMVHAQRLLVAQLGIRRLHAVIGGSMGGMQVLEWALLYPEIVETIIPIATSAAHSPWSVAFNAIAREAIALGRNGGDVEAGLRLARKVAMMTYRSSEEFSARFGRRRSGEDLFDETGSFAVEGYLTHHGDELVKRFDAETYRTITLAMDLHDIARDRGTVQEALESITQPALCVGISTDVLYPAQEQREIAWHIPNGSYCEITSPCGHDAFLIEYDQINRFVSEFLTAHPIGASEQGIADSGKGTDRLTSASALTPAALDSTY